MRHVHPLPRHSGAAQLQRVVLTAVRDLRADARSAHHAHCLYPGAPVLDPETKARISGWRWERRHIVYGPAEALFLVSNAGALFATILPPSCTPDGTWRAEITTSHGPAPRATTVATHGDFSLAVTR